MPLFHLILVAIVQGVTEFLPVSSSGHLILLPALTGMEDQGQVIDVAVHVGTLGAVMIYFRSETARLFRGIPSVLRGRIDNQDAWLALGLTVSTIPVLIGGLILVLTGLNDALRSMVVIGWATLGFGLVLFWADRTGGVTKTAEEWSLRDATVMGLWQVLALIPGTSRSGITITGARTLGYERSNAARLAMLMSIPTILMAGILTGAQAIAEMNGEVLRDAAIAAVFAFLAAMAALALMMKLLKSVSFTPYVIYRICLGLVILAYAYT